MTAGRSESLVSDSLQCDLIQPAQPAKLARLPTKLLFRMTFLIKKSAQGVTTLENLPLLS